MSPARRIDDLYHYLGFLVYLRNNLHHFYLLLEQIFTHYCSFILHQGIIKETETEIQGYLFFYFDLTLTR